MKSRWAIAVRVLHWRGDISRGGTVIASSTIYCIAGVTRNAASALEVLVPFDPIGDVVFGPTDALSVTVSARIGTDGNGAFCGGHANAVGLRLYFDAASRPARFEVFE